MISIYIYIRIYTYIYIPLSQSCSKHWCYKALPNIPNDMITWTRLEMTVMHPPPRFSSLAEFPSLWNASIPKHLEMFPWVWKLLTKNYSREATVSKTIQNNEDISLELLSNCSVKKNEHNAGTPNNGFLRWIGPINIQQRCWWICISGC